MAREGYLARGTVFHDATIEAGEYLSEAFFMGDYTMLVVHMPSAWTSASIGFHVSSTRDGTFLPLYDAAAALVDFTPAASRAYAANSEVGQALWFKLWSQNGSGVNVTQDADRVIRIELKS